MEDFKVCLIETPTRRERREPVPAHNQTNRQAEQVMLQDDYYNLLPYNPVPDSPIPIDSSLTWLELPEKITGTYTRDYNILYVDSVIRKRLAVEKYAPLRLLQKRLYQLQKLVLQPQTYLKRERTLQKIKKTEEAIRDIESGAKARRYHDQVESLLQQYRCYEDVIKTVSFGSDNDGTEEQLPTSDRDRQRLHIIETYLDIASQYITLNVVKIFHPLVDICLGCGGALDRLSLTDVGTLRCPVDWCQTEHNTIIMSKLNKDGSRVTSCSHADDESIENFLRAFNRYQGLQSEHPNEIIYDKLDEYFAFNDLPTGEQVRQMPLNNRGRRGETTHRMLWNALSAIGHSEYYEDANLIGSIYWGWTLPYVMQYREIIISHYNKTQRVFYQIPLEERERTSSLGTQYRLWRHLQLVGHECYIEEFKIAENAESFRTHNKLWRTMCEQADDSEIYYIP